MWRAANDVLAGKQPVSPAEAAHVVESLQEKNCRLGICQRKVAHPDLFRLGVDVREELAVGKRTVGAEFMQYLGERVGGHGDLAKVVEQWDLCRALA